jgi:hypothetical protein
MHHMQAHLQVGQPLPPKRRLQLRSAQQRAPGLGRQIQLLPCRAALHMLWRGIRQR